MTDDYPTKAGLRAIKDWPFGQWADLLAYIKARWWMADWGWRQRGRTYYVSTGGWSGNEDLICALREHIGFWSSCWCSVRAGGHYTFSIPVKKMRGLGYEICRPCRGSGLVWPKPAPPARRPRRLGRHPRRAPRPRPGG